MRKLLFLYPIIGLFLIGCSKVDNEQIVSKYSEKIEDIQKHETKEMIKKIETSDEKNDMVILSEYNENIFSVYKEGIEKLNKKDKDYNKSVEKITNVYEESISEMLTEYNNISVE